MADATNITEMLQQLGWGSGFRLPIANDENKELERVLEMKQSKMLNLTTELQETNLAVDNSTAFIRLLKSKIQHSKDVEAAKRSQSEKEKNLLVLAEKDHTKGQVELKNLDKRLKKNRAHNKVLKRNILRRNDTLGELVDTIKFDKTAITEYENKFSKEDAYLKLIEEFAESDKEKYEQCKDEYRVLGEKIVNSKMLCNQTILESEILEGELESLTKRFRMAHAERNQLIDNWKGALRAMEGRDKEAVEISQDYKRATQKLDKITGLLSKQEAFYETIQNQSRAYAMELNQLDRTMVNLNTRKKETDSISEELTDSIPELAAYIFNLEKEIRSVAKQFKRLSSDTAEWKEKMEKAKGELESLKTKYDLFAMESMTSAEHVKQLDEFLENEEKKGEALLKEFLKQINFKSQRERQAKRFSDEANYADVQARNLKVSIASAKKNCTDTRHIVVKNQSMAHGLDIQSYSLLKKIHNLENPESMYSKEDYTAFVKQIAMMKENQQELVKMQFLLKTQASHCDNVINLCQKEIVTEGEQNKQIEIHLHMLEMEIKRIVKDDEMSLDKLKDVVVNNSLLHIQLSRLLHSIKDYEEKLFDLEQERVTLHSVVKARKKDIEGYYALLQSKKRVIMEECQKLKLQTYEVSGEVEARKRRYEDIMLQLWQNTESGGESPGKDSSSSQEKGSGRSPAYFIIKIAQEKEHYKQEGDKWDERVKEAEKIVEGLQNTLALMMGTNEAFKDSLKPATINTPDGQRLEELKEKEYVALHNLRVVKAKRKEFLAKLEAQQGQLDKAASERGQLEYALMERQYDLQNLTVEINGQKAKIRRATQQANKIVKELSTLETLDAELLQNDLRLRITKEKYEFACATLEKLLSVHPYLIEEATEFLEEKGMGLLKERILKKPSLSLSSSPHESGQSTPRGTRKATEFFS